MDEIRAANEDDFAAVRSLLADSALVHEDLTPASLDTFVVVPARDDPAVLAAVAGLETLEDGREGLLRSVAVSPTLRGHGVGASLVAAIEAKARTLGLERLWLLTTTAPDFFRRLGYAESVRAEAPEAVRQSSEFKSLCPASAVCLSKRL